MGWTDFTRRQYGRRTGRYASAKGFEVLPRRWVVERKRLADGV
ncbi:hypothetical protein SO078_30145 (plasmid) [Sinorhizobium meliloti]|nr:hypothetical protein [Sinorhizobium meliloti]WRQ72051.1 hypothetical protein SO078_30145 [Sinorhizobium meliloti]